MKLQTIIFLGGTLLSLQVSSVALAVDNDGGVITRWNEQALATVRAERLGASSSARLYGLVNVAMWDAVNAIDGARRRSRRENIVVARRGAPTFANRSIAAAAAAHAVLCRLAPDLKTTFDAALTQEKEDARGSRRAIFAGLGWGADVGRSIAAIRSSDGSAPAEVLPAANEPGKFRSDFNGAQFRNLEPLGISSKAPYVSEGPPALDSLAYEAAFADVKYFGDARIPRPDLDEIWRFWRGGGGSARPPGEWIKVAIVVAHQEGTAASLSDTARLFALLGMALHDAVPVSWTGKFDAHFWRPGTAVREGDTDGNAHTVGDPGWMPRNGSFGSSPEHTSGQSTFAGAGSTVLAGFYCRDDITFTFEGDDAIGGARTFTSFSAAGAEAGRARIYAGIHFQFSNQAGLDGGRGVAQEILKTRLRKVNRRGRVKSDCPAADD